MIVWRRFSWWAMRAQSSAKSALVISLYSVFVFDIRHWRSNSEPSRWYMMYIPKSRYLKACNSIWVKNRLNSTEWGCSLTLHHWKCLISQKDPCLIVPLPSCHCETSGWVWWASRGSQVSWGWSTVHFHWLYQMPLSDLRIQNRGSYSVQGTFCAPVLQWRSWQQYFCQARTHTGNQGGSPLRLLISACSGWCGQEFCQQQRAMRCICDSHCLLLCLCIYTRKLSWLHRGQESFLPLPKYWPRLLGMPWVTPQCSTVLQVFHACQWACCNSSA